MTPNPEDQSVRQDLIQRLEAAEVGSRELDADLCEMLFSVKVNRGPGTWGVWSMEATGRPELEGAPESVFDRLAPYTTSLDAALALVERVEEQALDILSEASEALLTTGWKVNQPLAPQLARHVCIALLRSQEGQAQ